MVTKSTETGTIPLFGIADYVMFVLTLLISCGIGIAYAILDRNRHTTKDFLLGGQSMHPVPVAFSLMVTFMSAMTLLGNPAEIYNYHTMWWWLIVGMGLAMWWVSGAFIPFFYNLGNDSVFQYLEMRFNRVLRILGCAALILQTLLYMAFLLYAPALALHAVTGLHLWGSVVGMGCVVTFYTTMGGMKAVLWTDTFQAGVIIAGLLAVLIKGSIVQGGFGHAWEEAAERGRILFDDFSVDPRTRHSVWAMVIGGWGFWMHLYGVNQAQVQRCLSCRSVKFARIAMWLNYPGLIFVVSTCCMIGVVMFAFYKDCDPIRFGLIKKTDQLVPLYVMDILGEYPGIPGIFVSCVVSGSMSSLSSGLNALSAVSLRDILEPTCLPKLTEFKSTLLSKFIVVFYGILAIIMAYGVSNMGSVLEAVYSLFGILNGPLLGLFTLGMFFPWANKHGALVGYLVSMGFLLWIGISQFAYGLKTPTTPLSMKMCNWTAQPDHVTPAPKNSTTDSSPLMELYRLSYMYYTALGMVIVQVVGLPISFLTGYIRPETLDPRLICPLVDALLPCLPESWRKPFRFGIQHEGKYGKSAKETEAENGQDFAMASREPDGCEQNGVVLTSVTKNDDAMQEKPHKH